MILTELIGHVRVDMVCDPNQASHHLADLIFTAAEAGRELEWET